MASANASPPPRRIALNAFNWFGPCALASRAAPRMSASHPCAQKIALAFRGCNPHSKHINTVAGTAAPAAADAAPWADDPATPNGTAAAAPLQGAPSISSPSISSSSSSSTSVSAKHGSSSSASFAASSDSLGHILTNSERLEAAICCRSPSAA